uniref:SFRICE_020183 n=1 Tax=Spodoptera frugiperda TaxID=7108 RepID=A0A2H1VP72_SPOFR
MNFIAKCVEYGFVYHCTRLCNGIKNILRYPEIVKQILNLFLLNTPVNVPTYHLMVSNRRRPWTLETPEALQVRCRPLGSKEFKGCWGIGDWKDWEGGNWASSYLTHTTQALFFGWFSVRSHHSGRAGGPFTWNNNLWITQRVVTCGNRIRDTLHSSQLPSHRANCAVKLKQSKQCIIKSNQQSTLPLDTQNPRAVISALPAFGAVRNLEMLGNRG